MQDTGTRQGSLFTEQVTIRALSLQSGSNGNCFYVEALGKRLLFDAGICGVETERRLAAFGISIRQVDALILSHDHGDHARFAGVLHRKYGLPLYASGGTIDGALEKLSLGVIRDARIFRAGETLRFGAVRVVTVPTPHDGKEGSAFIVEAAEKRIGIMTDLGHPFAGLSDALRSLDAVFLESNYDHGMLAKGPYPAFLKRRISGEAGHISNQEAGELLAGASRLQWACLSHLSEVNNAPQQALRTVRDVSGTALPLHIAKRYAAVGPFEV
jgi:phosphoribosyl 1,2-cyclic phosphodiesterase